MSFDHAGNTGFLKDIADEMQAAGFIWEKGFHLKIEQSPCLRVRVKCHSGNVWYIFLSDSLESYEIPRLRLWQLLEEQPLHLPDAFDAKLLELLPLA